MAISSPLWHIVVYFWKGFYCICTSQELFLYKPTCSHSLSFFRLVFSFLFHLYWSQSRWERMKEKVDSRRFELLTFFAIASVLLFSFCCVKNKRWNGNGAKSLKKWLNWMRKECYVNAEMYFTFFLVLRPACCPSVSLFSKSNIYALDLSNKCRISWGPVIRLLTFVNSKLLFSNGADYVCIQTLDYEKNIFFVCVHFSFTNVWHLESRKGK